MSHQLDAELRQLPSLSMGQLRQRYGETFPDEFGTTHRLYLVRRIAWRLQASVYGGLSEIAMCRAMAIADETDLKGRSALLTGKDQSGSVVVRKGSRHRHDLRLPSLGTELSRVYRDRTITVTVSANGFTYEGHSYRSLSAVARAATGTQWNGLIFFGLAKRRETRSTLKRSVPPKAQNAT